MPSAHVKPYNGTPTLFLDGEPVFASMQWLSSTEFDAQGQLLNEAAIRDFARAGIHINAVMLGAEWCGPRPDHPDHFDFTPLGKYLRAILAVDPQALFHLRIFIETAAWWNELYPDECEIGSDDVRLNASYASLVWQAHVKEYLRRMVDYLRANDLYDCTIAYQFCPGVCGEWVKNVTSMRETTGDYSAPMRRQFRDWLCRHYADDAALQQAWGDPTVTLASAEVLSHLEHHSPTYKSLRNPLKEQKVVDYYHNLADLVAETLLDFCRLIKNLTDGNKLTGAFYGYIMDQAWNDSFFGGPIDGSFSTIQRSGHLGLRTVLESPDLDFIVSPYGYAFRGLGGDGLAMPPSESLRIHNKLYIYEEDSRLHNLFDPEGRNYAFQHAVAIHQRCLGNTLTHGFAIWWFADWPPNSYAQHPKNEPSVFNPWLPRFQKLGQFNLQLDNTPQAEVAVLVDDESFWYEGLRNDLNRSGIFYQRTIGLARFGAPHDVYLLNDFLEGRLPPYKLYLFLNPWHLDDRRRAQLKQELQRDRKTAVWVYAAGFLNRDKESEQSATLENMSDLTGFTFEKCDIPWAAQMHVSNFAHPITQTLPQDLFWGIDSAIAPIFHLKEQGDSRTTLLGQVVYTMGRCKPGFAVKEFGDWRSIWLATPGLPAPVLRGIARHAGVHLYSEAGDVLHASKHLLSVHTVAGGARTFKLPREVEVVYDLYQDRVLARDASEFETVLPPASSALYFMGETERLQAVR